MTARLKKQLCVVMVCVLALALLSSCGRKIKRQSFHIMGEKVYVRDNGYKVTEEVFVTNDKIKVVTALPGFVTGKGPIKVVKLRDKTQNRDLYLFPEKQTYCDAPTEFNPGYMTYLRTSISTTPNMNKKETVAGYECVYYGMETMGRAFVTYVATGLKGAPVVSNIVDVQLSELPDSMRADLKAFNCMPLKVAVQYQQAQLYSYEATQVRKEDIEESVFAVPSGYAQQTFEDILASY
jgi:hypothetical protein